MEDDGFGSWLFLPFFFLMEVGFGVGRGFWLVWVLGRCMCVLVVFEDERIRWLFGFLVKGEARFRGWLIVWQDGLYF